VDSPVLLLDDFRVLVPSNFSGPLYHVRLLLAYLDGPFRALLLGYPLVSPGRYFYGLLRVWLGLTAPALTAPLLLSPLPGISTPSYSESLF
jgi:hypothetical protein